MGKYYETFEYYDLPSYFADSQKKQHVFDPNGLHNDTCLIHDIAHKLSEICTIDRIDASKIQFCVDKGKVILKGEVESSQALSFILNAIDSLDGVMKIEHNIKV